VKLETLLYPKDGTKQKWTREKEKEREKDE